MKRFLMLVSVAVVAAAMYVAASSASQQSKGPTAKQFNALKKQVAAQGKALKQVEGLVVAVGTVLMDCTGKGALPMDLMGGPFTVGGYVFQQQDNSQILTSALNIVDPSIDPQAFYVMEGDATCKTDLTGLRHAATKAGLQVPAFHPSFTAPSR